LYGDVQSIGKWYIDNTIDHGECLVVECKKILHISNFAQKHYGRLYWNMSFRISNGLTRLGHNVYNFSDRDVARSSYLKSLGLSKHYLHRKLIETVKQYRPEVVVLGHADLVAYDTLSAIRKLLPRCKFMQWYVDNLAIDGNMAKLKKHASSIDHLFVTTGDATVQQLKKDHDTVSFFPNIFDASIDSLKIFEQERYPSDVFFAMSQGVGSATLKKNKVDARANLMRRVAQERGIACDFYGFDGRQPIWASMMCDAMQRSSMGLNINRGEALALYSSDRISTYIGNGLLTFLDRASKCEPLFSDDEVVYFDHAEDLIDKLKFYKKNDALRRTMAKRAWHKGHSCYNDKVVCQYMLQKVFNQALSPIAWPEVSY
jgi:hypothetical protein